MMFNIAGYGHTLMTDFLAAGGKIVVREFHAPSELAELPLWMIHIAWPLTGVTWVMFIGEHAWDHLRTLITGVRRGAQASQPHAEAV